MGALDHSDATERRPDAVEYQEPGNARKIITSKVTFNPSRTTERVRRVIWRSEHDSFMHNAVLGRIKDDGWLMNE